MPRGPVTSSTSTRAALMAKARVVHYLVPQQPDDGPPTRRPNAASDCPGDPRMSVGKTRD